MLSCVPKHQFVYHYTRNSPFQFIVLTPDFLLPLHFIIEVFCLLEKVIHFTSLFIPFSRIEHTALRLSRKIFTYIGDRKNYLLHSPIMPNNLKTLIYMCFSLETPQSQTNFQHVFMCLLMIFYEFSYEKYASLKYLKQSFIVLLYTFLFK